MPGMVLRASWLPQQGRALLGPTGTPALLGKRLRAVRQVTLGRGGGGGAKSSSPRDPGTFLATHAQVDLLAWCDYLSCPFHSRNRPALAFNLFGVLGAQLGGGG